MGIAVTTLTKLEIAGRIAELGISRRYARKVVDFFLQQLINAIQRGEIVHLVGFGAFRFKIRGSRQGRNPKTGQAVQVPAKKIVYFRPATELRHRIRDTNPGSKK